MCLCWRELTAALGRLTQRVDLSEAELEADIRQLSFRIQRLENIQRRSKAFRSELGTGPRQQANKPLAKLR